MRFATSYIVLNIGRLRQLWMMIGVMVSSGLVPGGITRCSRGQPVRDFGGISGRFFIHFPYRGSVGSCPHAGVTPSREWNIHGPNLGLYLKKLYYTVLSTVGLIYNHKFSFKWHDKKRLERCIRRYTNII